MTPKKPATDLIRVEAGFSDTKIKIMLKTKNLDRDAITVRAGSAKLSHCLRRSSAEHDRKAAAVRDETARLFADYAGRGFQEMAELTGGTAVVGCPLTRLATLPMVRRL